MIQRLGNVMDITGYCFVILASVIEPLLVIYLMAKFIPWLLILVPLAIFGDCYYLKKHNKSIKYWNAKWFYQWIIGNYHFYVRMFD